MKRLPTKEEFAKLCELEHYWYDLYKYIVFKANNDKELRFYTSPYYNYNKDVNNNVDDKKYEHQFVYIDLLYISYFWCFNIVQQNLSIIHFGDDVKNDDYCDRISIRLVSDEFCDGYIDMITGIYWAPENYHEDEKEYFTYEEAKVHTGKFIN